MKRALGFTFVELLLVLAVLGVIASIGIFNGRRALNAQEERAAVNTIRQSIWQGATAAAARGAPTELIRHGNTLVVRVKGRPDQVVRQARLPDGVTTNLPEGEVLVFTPPGKVKTESLQALPDPLTVYANNTTYRLSISLIGEVKAEVLP